MPQPSPRAAAAREPPARTVAGLLCRSRRAATRMARRCTLLQRATRPAVAGAGRRTARAAARAVSPDVALLAVAGRRATGRRLVGLRRRLVGLRPGARRCPWRRLLPRSLLAPLTAAVQRP